jgi:hypothetical protein
LFLLFGWLSRSTWIGDVWWSGWFMPVLIALLVAELVAVFRRPSGVRVATLTRRMWRDVVPMWAMALFVALAVAGLAFAATGAWAVMAGIGACLVLVLSGVTLAVRRPVDGDLQADAALRTRSARVMVGIGIAWMAAMLPVAANHAGFEFNETLSLVVFVVAVGGWILVANPLRRLPFVRAAR